MKLPKSAVEGAFQIGEKKYVLFAAFVLCAVEDHDQEAALLFRPGEVSSLATTPEGSENPFEMETAPVVPNQLSAATVEEAATTLGNELLRVAGRITAYEAVKNDPEAVVAFLEAVGREDALPEAGKCCGGHCKTDDAVNETPTPDEKA